MLHLHTSFQTSLNFHYLLKIDKSQLFFKNCPLHFFCKKKGAHHGLLPHSVFYWKYPGVPLCENAARGSGLGGPQNMMTSRSWTRNRKSFSLKRRRRGPWWTCVPGLDKDSVVLFCRWCSFSAGDPCSYFSVFHEFSQGYVQF